MIKLLISFVVVGLSFNSYSQPRLSMKKELRCEFINPIEKAYLVNHIRFENRDAALQARVIDQYIKKLDNSKIYLLKSDVEEIRKMMGTVFDKVKAKDCSLFDEIQKIVNKRIKERSEFAKAMLGQKYKFDSKVEFIFDPQKKPYPQDLKEAEVFLTKYIHFQISNYLAAGNKLDEAKKNVTKSWERVVRKSLEMKNSDIYAAYLDAFALALDPHSSYFSPDVNEDFRIQMSLSLEGIGATLSSQDGFTVVEALVPGGAAARSGLVNPQDKIIAVGQGKKGDMENVIEMDLRDVVKKIRGPKGTLVRLLILRKTGDSTNKIEVTLERDKVKLEDDAAYVYYQDREINGAMKKIAIISLPSFYSDGRRGGRTSANDVKELIRAAKEKNVEGIILDLANNGGGSLEDAVKIAGLFFGTGNVVKQSSRSDENGDIILRDRDPSVDWNGPLVVLTSRISASASEIVAGTLKDYHRAVILGSDHTFGKGTVQTVSELPPGSAEYGAVKVTVGMFFTAGGSSTQHKGVEADIIIPGPFDIDDVGEKYLDYSLPPKQIPAFLSQDAYVKDGPQAWSPINPEWIKTLAQKSKERVDKSADFKKIKEELEKSKAKGKVIRVADTVKDKEKREAKKAKKTAKKEDREKEYFKRADVQEAINVLGDLIQISRKGSNTALRR